MSDAVRSTITSALLIAALLGIVAMWQKVFLQEERHAMMLRVDEIQSSNIQSLQQNYQQLQRISELLTERQGLNIKAIESLTALVNTILQQNTEQQYSLNSMQERLRYMESRMKHGGP